MREARREPAQRGAAFISEVDLVAHGVGHADPLRFCRGHHLGNICFALDFLGSDLCELGACVQPHAQRLALHHSFWAECVKEAMPVSGVYLLQCASTAVHVFVKRGHVRPKVRARAGGPHEKAEGSLKVLARYLLGACQLLQLLLQLAKLAYGQVRGFQVGVECPTAPGDDVAKLCFLPTDGCIDAGEEKGNDRCLLWHAVPAEQCEQVVDIQPCAVAEGCQECVHYAEHLASCSLPPVCAELCAKVADNIVI